MRRVLHLVRSDAAALPAGVVAGGDTVVYTRIPECPPPVPCFLWCPDDPAGGQPGDHVPIIDSTALCELVFAVDSVVVW